MACDGLSLGLELHTRKTGGMFRELDDCAHAPQHAIRELREGPAVIMSGNDDLRALLRRTESSRSIRLMEE